MSVPTSYIKKLTKFFSLTSNDNDNKKRAEKILLKDVPGIRNYFTDDKEFDLSIPIDTALKHKDDKDDPFIKVFGASSHPNALFYAVNNLRSPELCELLLKHGADPNQRGNHSQLFSQSLGPDVESVLMSAMCDMPKGTIELLIQNGADVFYKNRGRTVLDHSILRSNSHRGQEYRDLCDPKHRITQNLAQDIYYLRGYYNDSYLHPYHYYNKLLQLQPLMAELAQKMSEPFLAIYSSMLSTQVNLPIDILNIIAFYYHCPLKISDISLILSDNPKLYHKIKENLLQLFKDAYHACKKTDPKDESVGSINYTLSYIFNKIFHGTSNQVTQEFIEVEGPKQMLEVSNQDVGDAKSLLENNGIKEQEDTRADTKTSSEKEAQAKEVGKVDSSNSGQTKGYFMSWNPRAWFCCRKKTSSESTSSVPKLSAKL